MSKRLLKIGACATLMAAFFMAMLDTTIVNITLPMMTQYFHTSVKTVSWVSSGYNLAFAVLLITASRLADQFGRKKVFMFGLFLFTLMSYACGISKSVEQLIFSRVMQGFAGAIMVPVTLPMVLHIFPNKKGGVLVGIWASVVGLAAASGPALGGIITDKLTWQWIFFINIPIGIITFIFTAVLVKESKDTTATHWIDWSGMLSITAAAFAFTYAFIEANDKGWGSLEIVSLFVLSVAGGIIFVIAELRAREPMLPMWLMKITPFSFGCITMFIIGVAMMNGVFFLSFYLTEVMGMTEFRAGLIITALPLSSIVFSAFSGPISDKIGSRWFTMPGMALLILSIYSMSSLTPLSNANDIIVRLVLMGIATGLTLTPIIGASVRAVPMEKIGIASGVGNMTRTMGQVMGVSIIIMLFTNAVDVRLAQGKVMARQEVMASTVLKKGAKESIVQKLESVRFSSEGRLPAEAVVLKLIDERKAQALADAPDFMRATVEKQFEKQKNEAVRLYAVVKTIILKSISNAFSDTFKINSILIIIGLVFAFFSEPGIDKKHHRKKGMGFHIDV